MGKGMGTGKGSACKGPHKTTAGAQGWKAGWSLLRACESRNQVRDGGDTPRGNVESTVAGVHGRACRQDPLVHPLYPGTHVTRPLCPRRPRRPRPGHYPCSTFSDSEHAAGCAPAGRSLDPCLCLHVAPFLPDSSSLSSRTGSAKTAAPPQRSVRAGTAGDTRLWQVPWMISARSCPRRVLRCEPRPASLKRGPGPGRGNQHGRRQRRPRTSPRLGVRVHGSTHRTFQPVTASVACI
jgi:hypothetical protein